MQNDTMQNDTMQNDTMPIISVINYKGGVGKTTVTANLAAELAHRGKKVLLLDMDAQASLTFSFVEEDDWHNELKSSKTIKHWFDAIIAGKKLTPLADLATDPQKVNGCVKDTGGKVTLISSHLELIDADIELASLLRGKNIKQFTENYRKVYGQLKSAIHTMTTVSYDVVLIDCPPNFNIITKNALIASDGILIPAKLDHLSTIGITELVNKMNGFVDEFNKHIGSDSSKKVPLNFLGIVFTMVREYAQGPIKAQKDYKIRVQEVEKGFKDKGVVLPNMTSYFRANDSAFASNECIPVVLHPDTPNKHPTIVQEIEAFVDEFMKKIGLPR